MLAHLKQGSLDGLTRPSRDAGHHPRIQARAKHRDADGYAWSSLLSPQGEMTPIRSAHQPSIVSELLAYLNPVLRPGCQLGIYVAASAQIAF